MGLSLFQREFADAVLEFFGDEVFYGIPFSFRFFFDKAGDDNSPYEISLITPETWILDRAYEETSLAGTDYHCQNVAEDFVNELSTYYKFDNFLSDYDMVIDSSNPVDNCGFVDERNERWIKMSIHIIPTEV